MEEEIEQPVCCPFCKGRTEMLAEDGALPEDTNMLCWCYSCKIAFAIRQGMDVDEWFRELQFSAGDALCKDCVHEDKLTCLNDKDRTECFEHGEYTR